MFGVLYIIQTREVKAIYQEKRERGLVMVRYILMNLRSLLLGDLESIDENISGLIREDLAYVISTMLKANRWWSAKVSLIMPR